MYDIALFINGSHTLSEVYRILEKLDDMGVEVDYGTLDFQDNGLFMDAGYAEDLQDMESKLNAIGVEIDWDTMSDWPQYETDEEDEE